MHRYQLQKNVKNADALKNLFYGAHDNWWYHLPHSLYEDDIKKLEKNYEQAMAHSVNKQDFSKVKQHLAGFGLSVDPVINSFDRHSAAQILKTTKPELFECFEKFTYHRTLEKVIELCKKDFFTGSVNGAVINWIKKLFLDPESAIYNSNFSEDLSKIKPEWVNNLRSTKEMKKTFLKTYFFNTPANQRVIPCYKTRHHQEAKDKTAKQLKIHPPSIEEMWKRFCDPRSDQYCADTFEYCMKSCGYTVDGKNWQGSVKHLIERCLATGQFIDNPAVDANREAAVLQNTNLYRFFVELTNTHLETNSQRSRGRNIFATKKKSIGPNVYYLPSDKSMFDEQFTEKLKKKYPQQFTLRSLRWDGYRWLDQKKDKFLEEFTKNPYGFDLSKGVHKSLCRDKKLKTKVNKMIVATRNKRNELFSLKKRATTTKNFDTHIETAQKYNNLLKQIQQYNIRKEILELQPMHVEKNKKYIDNYYAALISMHKRHRNDDEILAIRKGKLIALEKYVGPQRKQPWEPVTEYKNIPRIPFEIKTEEEEENKQTDIANKKNWKIAGNNRRTWQDPLVRQKRIEGIKKARIKEGHLSDADRIKIYYETWVPNRGMKLYKELGKKYNLSHHYIAHLAAGKVVSKKEHLKNKIKFQENLKSYYNQGE